MRRIFLGLELDVARLALDAAEGLVQQDAGVGQTRSACHGSPEASSTAAADAPVRKRPGKNGSGGGGQAGVGPPGFWGNFFFFWGGRRKIPIMSALIME